MAETAKTIWIEKFFEWELPYFDSSKFKNLGGFHPGKDYGFFSGTVIRAFDRYNDVERAAEFDFTYFKDNDNTNFGVIITPDVLDIRCYFFLTEGENEERHEDKDNSINGNFKKVVFCVDVQVPLPDVNPPNNALGNKLKKMCIDDSSNKFVIKCKSGTIKTLKLILAACSPVFAAMFDSKEASNSMKITDFEPKVVRKMVEFCETDKIVDFEGYEEGVFKIAHKYQMPELMGYASQQMTRTATNDNRMRRLHMIAQMANVEQFEKWCSDI